MEETYVIIVGAGPAGLATSACLNLQNISNIVLEKEDCCVSLWKKRAYDRLKLHLAKQFCELPHMPFPNGTPNFVPRKDFIHYLDNYTSHFEISPRYHRSVELAFFDRSIGKWRVVVENRLSKGEEVYLGKFLVVASGENSEGFIPRMKGLESFEGEFIHASGYKNGEDFYGKQVLVVGSGNSGMEIAYDLSNWNVKASICVRSPVHILTKEIVFMGMVMLKFLPVKLVDMMTLLAGKLKFGDLSKYGFHWPKQGPFLIKQLTGRSPTIDVGCIDKIKIGQIKVLPSILSIDGNEIKLDNGESNRFDAIIFDEDQDLFNNQGNPKSGFPNHWKGQNGLYCAGFGKKGLFGISIDAQNIANDIRFML
ncbi:hypothetical protein UlMin_000838 [Ulmus minor]